MKFNLNLIWTIVVLLPYTVHAWFEYCDHDVYLNQSIYIASPNYPNNYYPGTSCRYQIIAPIDYEINIECNIRINKGTSGTTCGTEFFYISNEGDKALRGSEYVCGTGYIQRKSLFNKMTIAYTSSSNYYSGAFSCFVTFSQQACDCGWSMGNRIVGGVEAKITEYPFMAGLKNSNGDVFCGGSIISHRCILTAAHCFGLYNPVKVVVGEHDLKTSAETRYTQEYFVVQTRKHEAYNPNTNINDIAIVVTSGNIEWSLGVGPICLPLLYIYATFEGIKCDMAGWGTTSFGGPTSTVLLKTEVEVVNNAVCSKVYPDMTNTQLCTYTPRHDSCQSDSGGPVIWKSKRLQLVAIISYGKDCGYSPAVNTRLTSHLDWIQRNTGETYCRQP